ncbi:phage holin family protein [Streptomyces sp. NPDC006458]|uniref:phage holin family protein n=1 Tax=Streptomyces sp. NPDC006458 TaxID=3154302 RepID=UPI0033B681DF
MDRLDHLEHLDKALVDELAQVTRETVRDELRRQTRGQRRRAVLYAASGAVALYAGAALALTLGLALAAGLPDWAAALITAVILGVVAYLLRGAARPGPRRTPEDAARGEQAHGGGAPLGPPGGLADPAGYPPVPPVAPGPPGATGAATAAPGAATPAPGDTAVSAPRPDDIDPGPPHHRA